jgi:hypothetical protein
MTAMEPINRRPGLSIEDALEDCRRRLARGESVEDCLAAHPAHADELAALLPLIVQARALARDPDPAYAAAARRRFQAAVAAAGAARARAAPSTSRFGWLKRLALPAALVVALVFSGAGLARVSADDSVLPDSPLYTVKQVQERAGQLLAARTPSGRIAYQAKLAMNRASELEVAERLHAGPALQRQIATSMVNATNQLVDEIAALPDPDRATFAQRARPLLAREQRDLRQAAATAPKRLAPVYQQLEGAIQADQQKLSS